MDNPDNSTTSSNGKTNLVMNADNPIPHWSDPEAEETFSLAHEKPKKVTRSYKTELGKMTRERDKWQAIAFSSFISSAIFLAALAYKMFS
jgi:hypothetical protein